MNTPINMFRSDKTNIQTSDSYQGLAEVWASSHDRLLHLPPQQSALPVWRPSAWDHTRSCYCFPRLGRDQSTTALTPRLHMERHSMPFNWRGWSLLRKVSLPQVDTWHFEGSSVESSITLHAWCDGSTFPFYTHTHTHKPATFLVLKNWKRMMGHQFPYTTCRLLVWQKASRKRRQWRQQ